MGRTPSSDAELEALGTFQGKIERNSNFRDLALNHNLSRNVRVLKLLVAVRLMRQAGKTMTGSVICTKARKQNFKSKQDMTIMGLPVGPVQAAHWLPGTLFIGGIPVWDYITDPKFKGQLEFLFGEVEHLPAVFNQADTSAEAKGNVDGLCAALSSACRTAITTPLTDGLNGALKAAWPVWTEGALIGLRTALAGKTEKGGIPPLIKDREGNIDLQSLRARETASRTEWNRENAVWILGYYIEDQERRDWSWVLGSGTSSIAEIESLYRS